MDTFGKGHRQKVALGVCLSGLLFPYMEIMVGLVCFFLVNLPFGECNWKEPLLNHISVEGLGVPGSNQPWVLLCRQGSLPVPISSKLGRLS